MQGESDLSREDQFKILAEWPGLMEEIFRHMANGGDLITYCEPKNIRYCDLAQWISKDADRVKIYSQAVQAGNEWVRQRILNELRSIGLANIKDLYDDRGLLKPMNEWPDETARALTGVEIDETFERVDGGKEWSGYTKKVKLMDKVKALEAWGKELGMFSQKIQVSGSLKLEDLVAGSRENLNETKT